MDIQCEETYIHTNGIRLHVIQAGPQDGPLVVLLHGFPEFWRGWQKQIEPLAAAGYRVVVPDQRGYNLSDVPKSVKAYSLTELGKDVIGILEALGRKDCCLAGHDWGAAVAWYTALAYPGRVRKLAIHNVPHLTVMNRYVRRDPGQMRKSWYIGFFQIPFLPEWFLLRNDYQMVASSLRSSSQPGTFTEEDLAEYKTAWRNSGGVTGMINWYRAMLRYPPAKFTDIRLHMPVLVQWGKQDAFLSYEMAEESVKLCDQGRLVLYEEATHWVQHEEAKAVANNLIDFFS